MDTTRRLIVLGRTLAPAAAVLIAATLIVLQLAVPATASGPDGTIRGYVTDRGTGSPVAGAIVRMEANNLPWVYELVTGAGGSFAVSAVPQTYNLIVLHEDYRFYQVSIGVGSLQTVWANASLDRASPRTAQVMGYANDTSTGAPVTVGRIVAVPQAPPFDYVNVSYFDTTTGFYAMGLVPGSYTLFTDSVPGYASFGASVTLADGQDLWLNVSLVPNPLNSDISGTAYDASTLAPLSGALVSVKVDDLFLPSVVTDPAGVYSISVPSGSATVTGNLVGYGPDTQPVSVAPTSSYAVDLYLRPILGSIRGYVSDASTALPLPNATVSAQDFVGYYEQVRSNDTGYYEIPVPEGGFSIQASAPGYFPYSTGAFANEGETVWSNLSMVPVPPIVATVQGYAVDASTGGHVSNLTVFAFDFQSGFSNVTITDALGFYRLGIVESPLLLVAVSANSAYAGGSAFTGAAPGDSLWVNVTVYPLNATVRAHVTDGVTGLPISDVFVTLSWGFPFPYFDFNTTNGSGYADLKSPATSGVNVSAFAPGYFSDSRILSVVPGFNAVALVLYPVLPFDVVVKGYIREGGTGNPLAGAQVRVSGYPGSANATSTDPSGYYEMWIVAAPQRLLATYPQHVANETTVSPNPGETIWRNLTLAYDPNPPWIASFTATPSVGVNAANPTSLVADLLEVSLDPGATSLSLLRLVNVSGSTGTFDLIKQVDPADLAIVQPSAGAYTVSSVWDARAPGGWIGNGTVSEWWPLGPSPLPTVYAISGLWDNGTVSGFMGAFFDPTTGDLLFIANESLVIPPAAQPTSTFTPATMGLQIDLGSGTILGGLPVFGASYRLAGLRLVYDDRVPSGEYAGFLQATDTGGNANYSAAFFNVDSTPPVANAGADQAVSEDTLATFDGSGSRDDVGIVNYTWTFTDGSARTLYGVSPTYTFATPGAYVVTLSVRDSGGSTDSDTMTVTVRDVTNPVANAGPDQTVNEDTPVAFDGSGSTDNVGVTNYTWTFTDGTVQTLYGSAPSYTFATPGAYVVTLTVRDGGGNAASDSLTVTVRDVTNPVANAGPDQGVDEDATVTFTGVASTDNLGVTNYTWTFTDGSARTLYGSPATYVFATPGVYTVTLTVRDAAGNSATDTLAVTVRDVTDPAVAIDSPPSGATVSGTITVGVTASDNVGVARVELRVDGTLVATDTTAPYAFTLNTGNYSNGDHTFQVTAYDLAGNSVAVSRTVTISNVAPPSGLGLVEYGGILLAVVAVAAVAWFLLRRGKGRRPVKAPSGPSEVPAERESDDRLQGP